MPVVQCPNCLKQLQAGEHHVGHTVACRCGGQIHVPLPVDQTSTPFDGIPSDCPDSPPRLPTARRSTQNSAVFKVIIGAGLILIALVVVGFLRGSKSSSKVADDTRIDGGRLDTGDDALIEGGVERTDARIDGNRRSGGATTGEDKRTDGTSRDTANSIATGQSEERRTIRNGGMTVASRHPSVFSTGSPVYAAFDGKIYNSSTHQRCRSDVACGMNLKLGKLQSNTRTTVTGHFLEDPRH